MVHQMDLFWMCGSVWWVGAVTPLSSRGSTKPLSLSPTGTQTSQLSPLRITAVSSTLERCVCISVHAFLCYPTHCIKSFCVGPVWGVCVLATPCCKIKPLSALYSIMVGRLGTAHRGYLLCVRRKESSGNQRQRPDVRKWVLCKWPDFSREACSILHNLFYLVGNWHCQLITSCN